MTTEIYIGDIVTFDRDVSFKKGWEKPEYRVIGLNLIYKTALIRQCDKVTTIITAKLDNLTKL